MATGAGASSSQLRDTSPTRQRTYPMPMSVQHMRVSNKATALRELHRSQRMHMEKLRNMKPGIDMKRPEQPKFLQYNAKRVQMEKERNLTIERENKILLGKMYSIMNSEPAYKTTQHKTISLNMSIRKQEYDRIARENQAIMQRILQREPEFDRARLDREWKETQRYLRNISEYPFILDQKTPKPSPTKKPLPPIKGDVSVKVGVDVDASGEVSTSTAAVSKTEEAAAAAAPAAAEYKEPEGEYATEP
jgi:hypothetical protein